MLNRKSTDRLVKPALRMLLCIVALTLALTSATVSAQEDQPVLPSPIDNSDSGYIVLIIDDMGNSLDLGERALRLPGVINYAFLPHSRYTKTLAETAHQQQHEVLLHAPMSNLHSHPTGPGALTAAMHREEFLHTLNSNLEAIPHLSGVNNHMGSLLTQMHQPMGWLMQALKQHQLYFVDSRTTPRTVAEQASLEHKVPTLRRDVFLDNVRTAEAIEEQFDRLVKLAQEQGSAVAIGHPYPETLSFLEQHLPQLAQYNIQLVRASELAHRCDQRSSACAPRVKLAYLKAKATP